LCAATLQATSTQPTTATVATNTPAAVAGASALSDIAKAMALATMNARNVGP
jgi:hypothetical protein